MNWLKQFISKPRIDIQYKILDSYKTNQHKNSWLDETISKEIDGFIIRNAINENQIRHIVQEFDNAPKSAIALLPNGEGLVYPFPYSMVHNDDLSMKYFSTVNAAQPAINTLLSEDANKFILNTFSPYTEKSILPIPPMDNNVLSKINFRKLNSNTKGISIHCENSFLHQLAPYFKKHLEKHVALYEQLSFFFVVKKIKDSGDIVLYSKEWNSFNVKHEHFSDEQQKSDDLIFFRLNNAKDVTFQVIQLNEGDLFVFRAGQIWHRVKNIEHSVDRITMGGFLSQSKKNNSIYYWA
jgi:hypothetical protein